VARVQNVTGVATRAAILAARPNPHEPAGMSAEFLFASCQPGAERALKDDVARNQPRLRFAFSRPGFVTFRVAEAQRDGATAVASVFARTSGHSLGKIGGADDAELAGAFWKEIRAQLPPASRKRARHLHVWQRERPLPGDDDFDAALLAPAAAAGSALLAAQPPSGASTLALNATARNGDLVLDCVLVAPGEWWLGWHTVTSAEHRWPGGVPPLIAPERMISRAYLKILETLLWADLRVAAGDHCVEIGSAPGGACLALLERGCVVTGIDPAEMDPLVLAQPGFTHVRSRAKDVKHSVFRDCRWLVMDANVAPKYTLDTAAAILARPNVRPEGVVLTLKLTDPRLAIQLPAFAARLARCGYRRVRLRQLAFNRQEICVVATDRHTSSRETGGGAPKASVPG
jgi:23S rRNA (cytidine2498-2'-O)-methyltransferase